MPAHKRNRKITDESEDEAAAEEVVEEAEDGQDDDFEADSDDDKKSKSKKFSKKNAAAKPAQKKGRKAAPAAEAVEEESVPSKASRSQIPENPASEGAAPTEDPAPRKKPARPKVVYQPVDGQRLLITYMVLENFKSYAGKQVIGPFHKCFSSIVGPNGSGKSNVIDALLFVFGKRAKQLRHKKLSELVHRSDKHPNLEYCKVSVYFQDIKDKSDTKDEYEVVPGSELIISRIAYKNEKQQPKYTINDRTVKWEEVEDTLRRKGIDLDHNRFLILQGDVEQIAMMKPKAQNPNDEGLLEYLEDIIGSNQYVEAIEAKGKEVEAVTEERESKLKRAKLVEKERDHLEGAKNEAEEYVTRERAILDKRGIVAQINRANEEQKAQVEAERRDKVEAQLKAEREQSKDHTEKLAALEAEHKSRKQQFDETEKAMLDAKSEFALFERKDIKFREEIKHLKSKEKKLAQDVEAAHKKIAEADAAAQKATEEIPELEAQIPQLQAALEKEEAKLEAIYASLKDETQAYQVEMDKKQKELQPYSKVFNEQQSAVNLATSELSIAKDRYDNARRQLAEVTEALDSIKQNGPKKRKQLTEMKKTLEDSKRQLPELQAQLQTVIKEEKDQAEVVRSLRSQVQTNKASLNEDRSRNRVVDALMKAKKEKRLSGIAGRLGDLGAIDRKYDVAISTACTPLNNIVVDTIDEAEACVQFLRENKLGVATFIALNKIQGLQSDMAKPFQAPSNSERLFDLIQVKDDKFRIAFYHALKDTLVCSTLDRASQIGYGTPRRRVVTLDGNLIETSGTLAGGGGPKHSGGMKASLAGMSAEELERLEEESNRAADALQEMRARKQQLEVAIETTSTQLKKLETDISLLDMDIKAMDTQEKELAKRLPELEPQANLTPEEEAKVKVMEKKIKDLEKELQKTKKITDKLEGEIQALHKQIMEAGGERMKKAKAAVESINKKMDDVQSAITKAKVQVKTAKKNSTKATSALAEAEKELEKVKAQHEATKKECKEVEEEALKVMQTYHTLETGLETDRAALQQTSQELQKVKKAVDKFRSREVELQGQIEDVAKLVRDHKSRAEGYAKRLADYCKQKAETKIEEADEEPQLAILPPEELENYSVQALQAELAQLEEQQANVKPNMVAIRDYRRKDREYGERMKELDEVTERRDAVRKDYDALRKQRLDEFMAGFSEITLRLKEMYQMITMGGDAELELVDSMDPFSEGIIFSVRPPKKSWKQISNLSGGEKTLSSLALVFALHHYKPTPLYVMDEIDAALDFKNVSIVANYIKERTKNAQFIIISLRNYMFELADHLVGIYKVKDCSRSVTIDPAKFTLPQGEVQKMATAAATDKENVINQQEP